LIGDSIKCHYAQRPGTAKIFVSPCRFAAGPFVYWSKHREFTEQAMPTNGNQQSSATLAQIAGGITLACGAFCAIPPTSIVGAILWVAYLGDLLASHIGSLLFTPILVGCSLGLTVLGGLWLRDRKLRALMPLRR
jgi:hypothetical protein